MWRGQGRRGQGSPPREQLHHQRPPCARRRPRRAARAAPEAAASSKPWPAARLRRAAAAMRRVRRGGELRLHALDQHCEQLGRWQQSLTYATRRCDGHRPSWSSRLTSAASVLAARASASTPCCRIASSVARAHTTVLLSTARCSCRRAARCLLLPRAEPVDSAPSGPLLRTRRPPTPPSLAGFRLAALEGRRRQRHQHQREQRRAELSCTVPARGSQIGSPRDSSSKSADTKFSHLIILCPPLLEARPG
jgi:hypothetical protein